MDELEWERRSKYYMSSKCERFKISKSVAGGKPVYGAWCKVGNGYKFMGNYEDADEAKARCVHRLKVGE